MAGFKGRLILVAVFSILTTGATKYKPIVSALDDLDSLRVYWRTDHGTYTDSALYTDTIVFDSVALPDTADYVFEYRWYSDGRMTHAATEEVEFKKNIPVVSRDTTASGYPHDTLGNFAPTGSGDNAVTIYAWDTGAGEAVANVELTVRNLSGGMVGFAATTDNGYRVFNLDDGDYSVNPSLRGYGFVYDTITVSGATNDSVYGAAWSVNTPSSASLCRVYGYTRDESGNNIQGVRIAAKIRGQNITDTAGAIVAPIEVPGVPSDTNGYWYIDLYRTAALDDTNKYDVEGWYGPDRVFTVKNLTIPSDTIFSIADTIGGR